MTAKRASPTSLSPILNIKIRAKRKQNPQEKKQQESRYASFFPPWVQSGHFCLPGRNPEGVSSFIYYLIHLTNLFYLPSTLGKSFSITSIPSQQAGQIHTKTDSNLLPAAWVPVSIMLNINFAFTHSVQTQKAQNQKRTQWTASWHPPDHSQRQNKCLPLFHQPQNCSQHAVGKGQKPNNYKPVEESCREQGHPQCPRSLKQWRVCSINLEVNKPCICSANLMQEKSSHLI